ncbi:MAG TPA: hypothetical protein VIX12_09275, partial [Candidatus Binataceae bacterium]
MSETPTLEAAAHADAAVPQRHHPYRAFALRAGLGIAIVATLLHYYDARPVFRILNRERTGYFIAAVLLYLAG